MAGPYASEPQALVFWDSLDVFESAEFTTGQVPSGSPVMFEFRLVSGGGLQYEQTATSDLTWPPALTQAITALPDSGFVGFLTDLRLEAWVFIDAFGYQWNARVWSDGLYLLDEAQFQPLLVANGATPSIALESDGLGIDTLRYDIALFTGVSLGLTLDAFPRASATITGTNVTTAAQDEPDDVLVTLDRDDQSAMFPIPEDDPGTLDLVSTWHGQVSAGLAVVFVPAASLNTPVGSIEVLSFEVPVTLVSYAAERALETFYSHPLPALAVPFANHDFEEVEVEALANLEVPLLNEGQLDLEGTLRIEGDPSFSVFPTTFSAAPGIEDGAVVTYTPSGAGLGPGDEADHTAILIIESNDPRNPVLEIPLRGGAFVEPDPELPSETPRVAVEGCGCASEGPGGPGGVASVVGFGLVALAARRRRA